ncbi:hypothetical protein [Pseudoalteromonas sp. APC 3691]|uniref:hypothetical protein n=1 Tax=Pseudoalteromonas sp. APC 3691 TaxID=3035173 RepID=UPI0025B375F1|nr:hypothetical protein [Pseudoalteromonas sp. APC 3691]MDN3391937.1 hypothetical protein [Pseudoalteromonas sp. APC 3691]
MKIHKIILVASLAISTSVFAGNGAPEPSNIDEQIYGSWNCQYSHEENGSKISFETEETYVRNGRSNSFGIMKAKFAPELPEIEYSLAGSATWNIDNGYLVTTLDDIKVVNLSHPELDKIINLQDMFPKNLSESSKILELSTSKLSLKSESDGTVYHCTKKLAKPQTKNFKFETGSGVFKIEEIEKIGIYSTHEYSFNGKKLGITELVGLEAKLLGSSEDTDYFLIKGATGGSACAEVLSIVRVTNDYLVFSPRINACGGIVSVDYVDDRDINRVNVKVLERDEHTKISYKVIGSAVLVHGRNEMKNQHSFLD